MGYGFQKCPDLGQNTIEIYVNRESSLPGRAQPCIVSPNLGVGSVFVIFRTPVTQKQLETPKCPDEEN